MLYEYSFILYIKTDNIYKDVAEGFKTKFDTSSCDSECISIKGLLSNGKNKKGIELMKEELGRKIMTKFVELRARTCSCLIGACSEDKKEKDTKKCAFNRKLEFENYKDCLESTQLENKKRLFRKK